MANLMQLEIVTPDKYFIKRDDVVYAGFEALDGGFGVFANHMPAIAALKDAPFKYRDANNEEHFIYLSGGFAEIVKTKLQFSAFRLKQQRTLTLNARMRLWKELKTALPTLRLILTSKEPKLPRQELSAESGQ